MSCTRPMVIILSFDIDCLKGFAGGGVGSYTNCLSSDDEVLDLIGARS